MTSDITHMWFIAGIVQVIAVSAMEVFPTAHPIPGTMSGNTDTIHYTMLTDNIYRFSPVVMDLDKFSMFHGVDEHISVDDYNKVILNFIAFYKQFINFYLHD